MTTDDTRLPGMPAPETVSVTGAPRITRIVIEGDRTKCDVVQFSVGEDAKCKLALTLDDVEVRRLFKLAVEQIKCRYGA